MPKAHSAETPLGLTVADIMTRKVYAAHGDDPVRVVLGRIRGHGFHHMPVVDREGELVGVVSDRDLFTASQREPEPTVAEVMTRRTVAISPAASAKTAAEQLLELGISCLPVLEEGHLVGMVTSTDFLLVAHRALSFLEMVSADRGQLDE